MGSKAKNPIHIRAVCSRSHPGRLAGLSDTALAPMLSLSRDMEVPTVLGKPHCGL